jgi:hypothetical protein
MHGVLSRFSTQRRKDAKVRKARFNTEQQRNRGTEQESKLGLLTRFSPLFLLLSLLACHLVDVLPPEPTPTPFVIPVVEFLYPVNEATVLEGAEIYVDILARDNGVGVATVEFRVDDALINERGPDISAAVNTFTVRMNWVAQGVGRHVFTATALRPDGTRSDPATILVNVLPPDGDLSALTPVITPTFAPTVTP